jgi:hypothetical protein
MKAYGGVDVYIYIFFTSALVGGEWSASRLCCFIPGERAPCTHWLGGWVDPRAGLEDMKERKFLPPPGLEPRILGRQARSPSLYRLSYPGCECRSRKQKEYIDTDTCFLTRDLLYAFTQGSRPCSCVLTLNDSLVC